MQSSTVENYRLPALKKLVTILEEKHAAAGDKPFALPYRDVAFLLGIELRQASRLMFRLQADGVLSRVSTGKGHQANEYRYLKP